jgi:peptidoglycan/LPS O-acetylase OafA/YrhL
MSSDVQPIKAERHLAFIDALRGVACLWVISCHVHAYWLGSVREHGWNLTTLITRIAGYGGKGVDLFIVLSGFCLFWPLVRSGALRPLAVGSFFQRRAWRLLPAYYCALVLCFALASVPSLQPMLVSRPVVWSDFFFHLPLLQTFSPSALPSINGSFWSLALEMQLYLAFPLIVGVVRRWGLRSAIILGMVAAGLSFAGELLLFRSPTGLAYAGLLDVHLPARWIEFILGMCAASAVANPKPGHVKIAGLTVLVLLPVAVSSNPLSLPVLITAPVFGAIFAGVVVLLARLPAVRLTHYRAFNALVFVGTVSYSLYLLHQPLLLLTAPLVAHLHLATLATFGFALVAFVPPAVALAYVCFHIWERPFLKGRPTATQGPTSSSQLERASRTPDLGQLADVV